MQKLVSCLCAVIMMISCFCLPSFSASAAASVPVPSFGELYSELVADYPAIEEQKYFALIYGQSSSKSCLGICVGNTYSVESNTASTYAARFSYGGYWIRGYESSSGDGWTFEDSGAGSRFYQTVDGSKYYFESPHAFYLPASSSQFEAQVILTNIPQGNFNYSLDVDISNTTIRYLDVDVTLDQTPDIVNPPAEDPTEPSTSAGFQLPDEWISGGETLPAGEIDTFDGINEDDAFQQFETLISDDSVINSSSFLNSVGLFWAIIIDFLDKLGAWGVVMLLMTLGVIGWVLGR